MIFFSSKDSVEEGEMIWKEIKHISPIMALVKRLNFI